MSGYTAVAKTKRLRAVILEMLQTNHDEQKSRLDSSAVWSSLVRGLGFDVSEKEVVVVVQRKRRDGCHPEVHQLKDRHGEPFRQ